MITGISIADLIIVIFAGVLLAPVALFFASSAWFIVMHFKGTRSYLITTLAIGLLTIPIAIILSLAGVYYAVWTPVRALSCYVAMGWKKRHSPREKNMNNADDEPADTDAVTVHLVHGTFETRAAWTMPGSPLRNEIARTCPQVKIARFAWSGGNTPVARTQAASVLAEKIGKSPSQQHYIIAHSHGGNIVRELSHSYPQLAGKIHGACLLSTPFLFRQPIMRKTGNLIAVNVFGFAFAILIPVFALYLLLGFNRPEYIAIGVFLATLLEIKLAKFCRASYDKEPIPENDSVALRKVAIFHAIGDEADSGLRFVSFLHETCFSVLSQLHAAAEMVRGKAHWPFFISYCGFAVLIGYEALEPARFTAWSAVYLVGLVTVLITHRVVTSRASRESPNALIAAAFPIGVFSFWLAAAKAIAYGDWRLIFCPEMFVFSSETPVGGYHVEKFAPANNGNLVHSTHSHPQAVQNIAAWLRMCLDNPSR